MIISIIALAFAQSGYAEQWSSVTEEKYQDITPHLLSQFKQARKLIDDYSVGKEGNLEIAGEILNEILQENEYYAPAYVQYARVLSSSGYIKSQQGFQIISKMIDKAIEIEPAYSEAFIYHASINRSIKNYDKARFYLEKAKEISTDSPWYSINLGRILLHERNFEPAIDLFKQVTKRNDIRDRTKSFAVRELVNHYKKINDLISTSIYYKKLLKLSYNSAYDWGNYAMILLYKLGKIDDAIYHLKEARKRYAYRKATEALAIAYYSKWAELKESDPVLAEEYYQKGLLLRGDIQRVIYKLSSKPLLEKTLLALGERNELPAELGTFYQPKDYKGNKVILDGKKE